LPQEPVSKGSCFGRGWIILPLREIREIGNCMKGRILEWNEMRHR
jgi:hypothetical protein